DREDVLRTSYITHRSHRVSIEGAGVATRLRNFAGQSRHFDWFLSLGVASVGCGNISLNNREEQACVVDFRAFGRKTKSFFSRSPKPPLPVARQELSYFLSSRRC